MLFATPDTPTGVALQRIVDSLEPIKFCDAPHLFGEPSEEKYIEIVARVIKASQKIGAPLQNRKGIIYVMDGPIARSLYEDDFFEFIINCIEKFALPTEDELQAIM